MNKRQFKKTLRSVVFKNVIQFLNPHLSIITKRAERKLESEHSEIVQLLTVEVLRLRKEKE